MKKEFEIKDNGERMEFGSGMMRDIADDKINYALIIPKDSENPMIKRYAQHLTNGAKKYAKRNFELAEGEEELERAKESAFRHFIQWYMGEEDEDHASATWFNIALVELIKEKMETNIEVNKETMTYDEVMKLLDEVCCHGVQWANERDLAERLIKKLFVYKGNDK